MIKLANPSRRIRAPRLVCDGGRQAAGFLRETNDCVVRAIANARCIPYAQAHELTRLTFGRQNGKGTPRFEYMMDKVDWARRLPIQLKFSSHYVAGSWRRYEHIRYSSRVVDGPATIDAFAKAYPKGHYILSVRAHALAVCDGVVVDGWAISGLKRIIAAWEVIA